MKYLNQTFTMPTCSKPISDLEYALAVGNISQETFDKQKRLSGKVVTENVTTAA